MAPNVQSLLPGVHAEAAETIRHIRTDNKGLSFKYHIDPVVRLLT